MSVITDFAKFIGISVGSSKESKSDPKKSVKFRDGFFDEKGNEVYICFKNGVLVPYDSNANHSQ
ncbi:MAG: hypothetical protein K1000chlam2_00286 [Chlamydiae bacterium]|nr:hypothetical protein [Chlamydiota bacterium]